MFSDFQCPLTRFSGELLFRGGRNLFLSAGKESRGGVELAGQQGLKRLKLKTRDKDRAFHAHVLLQRRTTALPAEETQRHDENSLRNGMGTEVWKC